MGSHSFCLFSVFLIFLSGFSFFRVVDGAGGGVNEECNNGFQKVMPCLTYATGKANIPTKDCCDEVKDLKDSNPKCLCFIIQQTNSGSAQIKSLGIQQNRLLQLPSACQLRNASVSFCPKLLGLSPSSPDAAIFTNTTTAPTTTPTGASATEQSDASIITTHGPDHLFGPLAIAMAIFIYTYSTDQSMITF
ncbi:non-specific lipid transfer protein GPI-anchored 1 [Manihot esculenta]|uniref:Bifunctional inhibitor/plant lipid transfer protein/seed storage helical domain-containing protein n=1 Tax=Manihot esculenta TaxID=3983 RepID=A0A2C9UTW2_MANES|nr:non-specific lipid transfer protein GPI-anchored 1 [Manihot esculenta]OAY34306.1 hypothetical protein MANES_12G010600v8 [Manihot esculenta]